MHYSQKKVLKTSHYLRRKSRSTKLLDQSSKTLETCLLVSTAEEEIIHFQKRTHPISTK